MTSNTRVTNAHIVEAIGGLTAAVQALVEAQTVAAQPVKATAKANTRTRKGASAKTPAAPAKVKVLTRKRAASFRARYAKYAGLTREQMLEAGLAKRGYSMPTGELRKALSQG